MHSSTGARRIRRLLVAVAVLTLTLVAMLPAPATAVSAQRVGAAMLVSPTGARVGFVTLVEQTDGRVLVNIYASGLTPGAHGIHMHGVGACTRGTTPAFASAGSHFNPTGALHGAHASDLGNLWVDASGRGITALLTGQFTLSPGTFSLLDANGSALVVHAGADDLVTDPTGNSGGRVACGVIQAVR